MSGTLSTPGNEARSVAEPKIQTAISTLNGLLDGSNKLDGAQLGSATVTDAKLASPNNSIYKTVAEFEPTYISGVATGTYYPLADIDGARMFSVSGPYLVGVGLPYGIFDFASADHTVASKTTEFRIRAQVYVGSSPSTVTFNVGLYPLTVSGGAFSLGTVVTGSQTGTTATPSLATNTISRYTGSDFAASTLLSDPGTYILGVTVGSITVPTRIAISAQLQTRNV